MKSNFSYCLVITNSNSTHIQRAMNLVGQLNDLVPSEKIEMVEISNLNYQEMAAMLASKSAKLGPDTLICIAGGDGTISRIIEILLTSGNFSPLARQSVILPLWGGNSNDLGIMANGQVQKITLKKILKGSRVVKVYPMAIGLKNKNKAKFRLAICYASFGVSAAVSEIINRPEYRNSRIYNHNFVRSIFEMVLALEVFIKARLFMTDIGDSHIGLYDLMLINGTRMAKRDRFPIVLTEKKFTEASIRRKSSGLFLYLLHAMNWQSTRPSETIRSLIVHDSIWLQIDGEVAKVPAQTRIDIGLNSEPFYLLSTKLKNIE